LIGHEIGDRFGWPWTPERSGLPVDSRFLNQAPRAHAGERISDRQRYQPCDRPAPHRHDDFAAFGNVAHIPAEVVVQLTNSDLCLQRSAM